MDRIYVKEHINLPEDTFCGTIQEVHDKIDNEALKLHRLGYKDFRLEWLGDYEYQYIALHYSRLENDAEFKRREDRIRKKLEKEAKDIEKRRALYQVLKREFEGKDQIVFDNGK